MACHALNARAILANFARHNSMIVPRFTLSIVTTNLRVAVSALAVSTFCFAAKAQDAVVTDAPPTPLTHPVDAPAEATPPPALELNPVRREEVHTVSAREGAEVSSEPRRFQYELRATVRGVYDDNINLSQTNKVSDYYIAIEPAITVGFGDITGHLDNYIRLDYAPSILIFTDHSGNDAVQQLVHLEGQHSFGHLTLTLGEDLAILDGTDLGSTTDATTPGGHVNLDVSGRTRVDTYSTRLNASYDLTGKTFLSSGLDSAITEYPSSTLFSSETISGNLFINYRYSDKVTVGIGGTGGYDFVSDPNPNQSFEQANARLSYQATGKVNFNASGGVEFRQFEQSSRGQYISPVFDLSASYQPFDGTNFVLSGNRRTYNSGVFAGQDFSGTTLTASLRQRLARRFFLGVSGGYEYADYFSSVSGVAATRSDNYYFVEPTLDFSLTRFWTVGVYYLHRQNDSSLNSFQFSDNQVGFRTTVTF